MIVFKIMTSHARKVEVKKLKLMVSELIALVVSYYKWRSKKSPDFSVYKSRWRYRFPMQTYVGKVYLVEFFFSTCPTICPKMNRNLVDIQNTFPNRPDFGIASFTINPDYDTQEVLKVYSENYGVTNPNWHFMTGDKRRYL